MPKTKPSWVCQHCERPFTTKYSLMRHFKRFAEHAPPNLHDGSSLRPITIVVNENENVRTVQAARTDTEQLLGVATTPHQQTQRSLHSHGTRNKNKQQPSASKLGRHSAGKHAASSAAPQTMMVSSHSQQQHTVPVVEETPSPTEFDSSDPSSDDYPYLINGPTYSNGQFPFLPPFLEDDQILDIATPLQQQSSSSESSPSTSSTAEPQSPLSAHYSWIFAKDTTNADHGGDLLSPLAPACNYGQVFSDEEEDKLHRLTIKPSLSMTQQQAPSQQQQQQQHSLLLFPPKQQRSPIELADLDKSLLLGDEEATSPFTFLEKTSSLATEPILPPATLDFLCPNFSHFPNDSGATSATKSGGCLNDLDFGLPSNLVL